MDSYVEKFQAAGGSMIMLAKGNRSKQVNAQQLINNFTIFLLDNKFMAKSNVKIKSPSFCE
jgi:tartrate dehydratase beta subunit/fumarate hydratase class I family protein